MKKLIFLLIIEIICPYPIESEKLVCITLPDGQKMSVPMINGWLPEISEKVNGNVLVRRLDYSGKYKGSTKYVFRAQIPKVELLKSELPKMPLMKRLSEIKEKPKIIVKPSYGGEKK